jgi:DNA-binding HxlR family transcriptional regulator
VAKQNALAKDRGKAKAGAQQSSPESLREQRRARPAEGPARAAELERLIHERIRLAIVSALAVNASLTFNDLKQLLNTTDGNLSVHARKLEEAQYVACNKYFDGRTPKTEYRLTAAGRKALERYLGHMESVIRAARGG